MEYTFCNDTFSDLFKEVNGFRPRGHHFDTASDDEKQKIWDDLCHDLEVNTKAEKAAELVAIEKFQARIDDVIGLGAGDRLTALRWITGQEKFYHGQDVEGFVWEQGILFTDYGKKLVKELLTIVKYEDMEWA